MKFDFRIIAMKAMRYPSVGDYFERGGAMQFRVAKMKNGRYHWLVFAHELIEWIICRITGVSMAAITKFDKQYEKDRDWYSFDPNAKWTAACGCPFQEEPGDDIHAPYYDAHQTATKCEKLIALALDVDWKAYEETVESL